MIVNKEYRNEKDRVHILSFPFLSVLKPYFY